MMLACHAITPNKALSDTGFVLRNLASLIFLAWIAVPGPALACTPVNLHPTKAKTVAAARNAFRSATAVIDAVVVDAEKKPDGRVILRSVQVWKGPQERIFVVQARSACDVAYWEQRSRLRLILNGGPEKYWATQRDNGAEVDNPEVFNRELDRLIGNQRPPDFRQPNVRYER